MLSQVSLFSSSPHGRGLSRSAHGSVPCSPHGRGRPQSTHGSVLTFSTRGTAFPGARTGLFLLSARAWPFPEHTRLCSHVLHTRHDLPQGTHAPVLPVYHTGDILSQGAHRVPFSRPAPVPRDTMCFPSKKRARAGSFSCALSFFLSFSLLRSVLPELRCLPDRKRRCRALFCPVQLFTYICL